MFTLKHGHTHGDSVKAPGRQRASAFRRAAAASAAALSLALASGCGATLAEGMSGRETTARHRPSVRILDWPTIPEASDETLAGAQLNLDSGNAQSRLDAVHALAFLYRASQANPSLREETLSLLIRTAKTDADPVVATWAITDAACISFTDRSLAFIQREHIRNLLDEALDSGNPDVRRIARYWLPCANAVVDAPEPKEVDEILRLLRDSASDFLTFTQIAQSMRTISESPNLNRAQAERIYGILHEFLQCRASSGPIIEYVDVVEAVFRTYNLLAINPHTPPELVRRMADDMEEKIDDHNRFIRYSARFHMALLVLGNKLSGEREITDCVSMLLKDGTNPRLSLDFSSHSIPERLLLTARNTGNPVALRRNALLAFRICVESGNYPPDITSERLLENVRRELLLSHDHSIRAELKALLSIIPQP